MRPSLFNCTLPTAIHALASLFTIWLLPSPVVAQQDYKVIQVKVIDYHEKTLELNGARFEVAFEDGRDMLRMIARSRKWLEEEFPLRDR